MYCLQRIYPLNLQLPSHEIRCKLISLQPLSLRCKISIVKFANDFPNHIIDSTYILYKLVFNIPARRLRRSRTMFKIPFKSLNLSLSDLITIMCILCNSIENNLDNTLDFSFSKTSFKGK